MLHTVAYTCSTTATADVDSTAITDSIETIQNGHIVPQVDKQLVYAWTGAVTLIRSKITSPTIRQFSPIQLRPIDTSATPTSRTPINDWRQNPPILKALEEIQVQCTNSAAGPNTCITILGLRTGAMIPQPMGELITMRGTGTTTVTAGAWTGTAITWADSLPQGNYACVGLNVVSATGLAARLIFDQQVERPGTIISTTDAIIPWNGFLKGGLGVMGYFNSFRMPNVECLCNSADTAQEVFLDFVRVG